MFKRQLRPREQLELSVLLEILRLQHAPRARGLRAHGEDVEEIAGDELDVGRRRTRADILQHAEEVVIALREVHAIPQRGLLRRVAHARLVHEREMRLHAASVELAHEVASPRKQHAHARAGEFPLDVRTRIDLRHALRRTTLGLVLRLGLWVVHPVHQHEGDGDDVRTHHREFLVRLAGALRLDVSVVEQLETGAHVPAAGQRDCACRLMGFRVPLGIHHRSTLAQLQRLAEHGIPAPADEHLVREIFRSHASTSTKRAAFASTVASSISGCIPRISASLANISPGVGESGESAASPL